MTPQALRDPGLVGQRAASAVRWVVLATIISAGCVLWFLITAISNERLAAHQRLDTWQRERVEELTHHLRDVVADWRDRLHAAPGEPVARFAERVAVTGLADSAVALPLTAGPVGTDPTGGKDPDGWQEAARWEHAVQDPAAAAERYRMLAENQDDPHWKALALQAQARCLAQGGRPSEAVHLLTESLQELAWEPASGSAVASIAANSLLRAMELVPGDAAGPARRLREILQDRRSSLPPAQLLFLRDRLAALRPKDPDLPEFGALRLAVEFRASDPVWIDAPAFQATPLSGVWVLPAEDRSALALHRTEALGARLRVALEGAPGTDVGWRLLAPGGALTEDETARTRPVGELLPGWQIGWMEDTQLPPQMAADRRILELLVLGGGALLTLALVATLVVHSLRIQARIARWKSDLVATVSHQLRTPLASIQALVETLLEGRCQGEDQRREYLELIASENSRLSELIENFLAFARMERGGAAFRLKVVPVREVTERAIALVRARHPGHPILDEAESGLPDLHAEPQALTTALFNLMDNAAKYSPEGEPVVVRTLGGNGRVAWEVEDRGAGLTRAESRHVFDRFYRADRSPTQEQSGVGLGLSVVSFIARAHHGSVRVSSVPGQGSCFRLELPVPGNHSNGRAASEDPA